MYYSDKPPIENPFWTHLHSLKESNQGYQNSKQGWKNRKETTLHERRQKLKLLVTKVIKCLLLGFKTLTKLPLQITFPLLYIV